MERRVVFIINPKAGVKKKIDIPAFINNNFPSDIYYDIILWKNKNDFALIQEQILTGKYTIAVAVGGDGTVNQIAKTINHTTIALGILPFGSGNGLARSIGVSMNIKEALHQIASFKTAKIDSGTINGIQFFCTSGLGFDAHIGSLFAASTKRGLMSYIKIIFKAYFSYKSKNYILTVDGKKHSVNAFLIAFANAGQYGNNFYISPEAKMNDGILNISILKPFRLYSIVGLLINIFRKKAHQSRHFQMLCGKEIILSCESTNAIHFDGEPTEACEEIIIKIIPNSLNVVRGLL